jgi:hypothetical protein
VVVLKIAHVTQNLVKIPRLDLDAVLKLDHNDDAVFEENEIWPAPTATMELELQNKSEAGGCRNATTQFPTQDADATVPRKKLRSAGFSSESGELSEDVLFRCVQKCLNTPDPRIRLVSHRPNTNSRSSVPSTNFSRIGWHTERK